MRLSLGAVVLAVIVLAASACGSGNRIVSAMTNGSTVSSSGLMLDGTVRCTATLTTPVQAGDGLGLHVHLPQHLEAHGEGRPRLRRHVGARQEPRRDDVRLESPARGDSRAIHPAHADPAGHDEDGGVRPSPRPMGRPAAHHSRLRAHDLASGAGRGHLAGRSDERHRRRACRRRRERAPARPLPPAHVRRLRRRQDLPTERPRATDAGTMFGHPPPGTRLLRRAGAHRHASRPARRARRATVRRSPAEYVPHHNTEAIAWEFVVTRHGATSVNSASSDTTRPGGGLFRSWGI